MEPSYLEAKSEHCTKNEKSNFEPQLLDIHKVMGKQNLPISLDLTY